MFSEIIIKRKKGENNGKYFDFARSNAFRAICKFVNRLMHSKFQNIDSFNYIKYTFLSVFPVLPCHYFPRHLIRCNHLSNTRYNPVYTYDRSSEPSEKLISSLSFTPHDGILSVIFMIVAGTYYILK